MSLITLACTFLCVMNGRFEKKVNTSGLLRDWGGNFATKDLLVEIWNMLFLLTHLPHVDGNIRAVTPRDCTVAYHKCTPWANLLSEEALFSSASFSLRKRTPVHHACESGVLLQYRPVRLPWSLDLGESCLSSHFPVWERCYSIPRESWRQSNSHLWVDLLLFYHSAFFFVLFLTNCSIICWWRLFHAGRRLWSSSRISARWSTCVIIHVCKMMISWVWACHT